MGYTVVRARNMPRYPPRRGPYYGRPRGVGSSSRVARAVGRGYSRTKTRNENKGQGVTSQYDRRQIYRRKPMPRYKKKRWVGFVKKTNAVNLSKLGTKSIVFNDVFGEATASPLFQYAHCVALYGYAGSPDNATNEIGWQDVRRIGNNDITTDNYTEKFVFSSAILDTTFHNTGTTKLEVDVYEIMCTGRNHGASWLQDYIVVQSATGAIDGVGTSLNLQQRGVTPFEFGGLSKLGYKIAKKTKFFSGPGEVFTYQMRDAKNRWVNGYDLYRFSAGSVGVHHKMTKCLVFIAKSVPGTPADQNGNYSIGCTRTYKYKVLLGNSDANENL